jgi:hypothetical protein
MTSSDLYASWVEELGTRVQAARPDVAREIVHLDPVAGEPAHILRVDGGR